MLNSSINAKNKSKHSAKRIASIRTAQIIAFGFLLVILLGSLLLTLPIASKDGQSVAYVDALFTATTSTCVTGLVTKVTATQWSLFGQIVILLLIQIGGLGVAAVVTLAALIAGARISIKDRAMLQQSYGLDNMGGIVKFILFVLKGTFIVETLGAIGFCFVFIKKIGVIRGIWCSIFTSISAFCNAGIDILGTDSLHPYLSNPIVNIVTMALIVMGGLGFPVWNDVVQNIKTHKNPFKIFKKLTLHSKIVLTMTFILIFGGAAVIMLLEWTHSMKDMNIPSRIFASLFQSVTLRTAGFFTVDQALLSNATLLLCLPLMLIGGSPAGCAGGVKTSTVVMLIVVARAAIREKKNGEIFGRRVSTPNMRNAITVLLLYFFALIVITVVFLAVEGQVKFEDGIFETVSAMATVGLSRGITGGLHVGGKLALICLMFIGRIGPITAAVALKGSSDNADMLELPQEEVMIG